MEGLKELVFSDLEQLLATKSYAGNLLPIRGSHEIFVPLLHVLDQLLVMGVLQEERDLKRLLVLLDPKEFATGKSKSLSEFVVSELCSLLFYSTNCFHHLICFLIDV